MAALPRADLEALSANVGFVEITIEPRDPALDTSDFSDLFTGKDEAPLASLADDGLDPPFAGSPPMLELQAFGSAFTIEADSMTLSHTLEFGYSVAGWTLFEELAEGARRGATKLGPAMADRVDQAIVQTEHSIGALVGSYLLSLEAAAEQLLVRVVDERIAYCDATFSALIEDAGGTPKLRRGEDGNVVPRAGRIVAELDGIRAAGEEIARLHRENAEPELFVRSIQLLKLSLDPYPSVLGDFGKPPAWIEMAAKLIGLDEASLSEQMREPRSRVDAAITIACGLRTHLILEEPWLAAAINPLAGDPPAGEDAIAEWIANAVADMRANCVDLKEMLAEKELTVRNRRTVVANAGEAPLLDARGYYDPGRHPESVLAEILDGGELGRGSLSGQYTLWNLAPLVTCADRNLRSAEADPAMAALLAAVLPSLRELRLQASLRKMGRDMSFGLFLAVGSAFLGPAGLAIYLSLNVVASTAEFVMTFDKFLLETTIEKSDLAGAHSTLVRLLDHSPDVLELAFSAANMGGSVMAIFPRLRALEKALNLATLGATGASVGLTLLSLALEGDTTDEEP